MKQIIELIEKNAKLTPAQIASMLERDEAQVAAAIDKMEKDGLIVGYNTLINWEKLEEDKITALIELKVTLQRGEGFDKVANRICQYPHVKTVWLVSGVYDIALIAEGKNIKDIALFVAEKLATIDIVTGTSTHFVLRTYKNGGNIFEKKRDDERGMIVL